MHTWVGMDLEWTILKVYGHINQILGLTDIIKPLI